MTFAPHQQEGMRTDRGKRSWGSCALSAADQFQSPKILPGGTCRGSDASLPAFHSSSRRGYPCLAACAGAVSAIQGCSRFPCLNVIRKLPVRARQSFTEHLAHHSSLSSVAGQSQQPSERLFQNVGNVCQKGPH